MLQPQISQDFKREDVILHGMKAHKRDIISFALRPWIRYNLNESDPLYPFREMREALNGRQIVIVSEIEGKYSFSIVHV